MGRHGKPSEHPPGTVWREGASAEDKAGNFDAYDRHLTASAPEDKSNPYSKENFKMERRS